ncbi:hypothetical protein P1X14_11695 [Sphingomonas sp. AOB5]|uniref:hypothetical protein n=1 Tax=Sphingomonas sp. AOB5 TaxID=3034017 RepID=UPI0023FA25B4|nr:hypothetical protein [Sphingomonas sp. AOB5]MDF7775912.1 hypothetical protein [Sphingomonas sp. AOB5]
MYRESDPDPCPFTRAIPLPGGRPEPGSMEHFWALVDEVPADDVLNAISARRRRDRDAGST